MRKRQSQCIFIPDSRALSSNHNLALPAIVQKIVMVLHSMDDRLRYIAYMHVGADSGPSLDSNGFEATKLPHGKASPPILESGNTSYGKLMIEVNLAD
jgi:hypothetical protein